jgi:hypothetical protein
LKGEILGALSERLSAVDVSLEDGRMRSSRWLQCDEFEAFPTPDIQALATEALSRFPSINVSMTTTAVTLRLWAL